MIGSEREQRQVACPLDGRRQVPLTLGAVSGFFAGFDPATVSNKSTNAGNIFVIDSVFLAVTLAAAAAAAAERRACALGGSGSGDFLPRGMDCGTARQTPAGSHAETATRAVPPRLLLGCLSQVR